MVTSESNRTQASVTSPFARQTQSGPLPAEAVAERPAVEQKAEEKEVFPVRYPIRFTSLVAAGATIGSLWGLSVSLLAILGLSGVAVAYMSPVAGIALGSSFLVLAGVDLAWAGMFRIAGIEKPRERVVFTGGVAAVLIAGCIGIITGILNLMSLTGTWLGAVAVIFLGLGLLWHSGVMRRISDVTHRNVGVVHANGPLAINALSLAPVRDFLVGFGCAILGLLALLGVVPTVLTCVALLAMGGALAFTTSTICGATLANLEDTCSSR
jgi:hypothetical protein